MTPKLHTALRIFKMSETCSCFPFLPRPATGPCLNVSIVFLSQLEKQAQQRASSGSAYKTAARGSQAALQSARSAIEAAEAAQTAFQAATKWEAEVQRGLMDSQRGAQAKARKLSPLRVLCRSMGSRMCWICLLQLLVAERMYSCFSGPGALLHHLPRQ